MSLSYQERLEIRERADFATPGPWARFRWRDRGLKYNTVCSAATGQTIGVDVGTDDLIIRHTNAANTEFIAHAREDVVALLDEVDRLRAVIEKGRLMAHHAAYYEQRSESPDARLIEAMSEVARVLSKETR